MILSSLGRVLFQCSLVVQRMDLSLFKKKIMINGMFSLFFFFNIMCYSLYIITFVSAQASKYFLLCWLPCKLLRIQREELIPAGWVSCTPEPALCCSLCSPHSCLWPGNALGSWEEPQSQLGCHSCRQGGSLNGKHLSETAATQGPRIFLGQQAHFPPIIIVSYWSLALADCEKWHSLFKISKVYLKPYKMQRRSE